MPLPANNSTELLRQKKRKYVWYVVIKYYLCIVVAPLMAAPEQQKYSVKAQINIKSINYMKSKTMKLKYLMLSLMGAAALTTASAQEQTVPAERHSAYKTAFVKNSGHWFLTLQGGVGATIPGGIVNPPIQYNAVWDRIGQSYSLSLGKEHNPFFATRLQLAGGELFYYPMYLEASKGKLSTAYVGGHFDFMLDLVDCFAKYSPRRVFHLTPFVGLGYQYRFATPVADAQNVDDDHAATANLGLQIAFRLGKRVDLVLEGQGVYTNFTFAKDKPWIADPYDGLHVNATAGLNFRLGRVEWEEVTPMDPALINDLNNQINALKAENDRLRLRPEYCPECPEPAAPEVVTTNAMSDKAILFGFDSDVVSKDQYVVLQNVANFVQNNNSDVLVIGYADMTGNADYNMGLSERRANAVKDLLVNEFGVDESKISVEAQGATDMFDTKAWNRAVIIRTK